jgi:hypothetical protein
LRYKEFMTQGVVFDQSDLCHLGMDKGRNLFFTCGHPSLGDRFEYIGGALAVLIAFTQFRLCNS